MVWCGCVMFAICTITVIIVCSYSLTVVKISPNSHPIMTLAKGINCVCDAKVSSQMWGCASWKKPTLFNKEQVLFLQHNIGDDVVLLSHVKKSVYLLSKEMGGFLKSRKSKFGKILTMTKSIPSTPFSTFGTRIDTSDFYINQIIVFSVLIAANWQQWNRREIPALVR